ncbi:hypothetical protein SBA4_1080005 [Candidatus Sulfopaludibacter sp. SbA4]|nr:hypothetical protein SBA4_1080005 [Candidatus Sulfopaludibacter sp. SbA4]
MRSRPPPSASPFLRSAFRSDEDECHLSPMSDMTYLARAGAPPRDERSLGRIGHTVRLGEFETCPN